MLEMKTKEGKLTRRMPKRLNELILYFKRKRHKNKTNFDPKKKENVFRRSLSC